MTFDALRSKSAEVGCMVKNSETEISGFCFTPQDGNSILSSIAATVRFLNPHSYQDKINTLGPFFFDRV